MDQPEMVYLKRRKINSPITPKYLLETVQTVVLDMDCTGFV